VDADFDLPALTTVIDTRKYAFHRKIERNRTAATLVHSILRSAMALSAASGETPDSPNGWLWNARHPKKIVPRPTG
jgi:hypothetical protein